MRENIALGKAGEFRVAAELLIRGYEVYLTTADSGVDLILGNGKKIQVKTAHKTLVNSSSPCKSYRFCFKSWKKEGGHYLPHSLDEVDFLILWTVEDDAFFIIPIEKVRGKSFISLKPDSQKTQSPFMAFNGKWDALR